MDPTAEEPIDAVDFDFGAKKKKKKKKDDDAVVTAEVPSTAAAPAAAEAAVPADAALAGVEDALDDFSFSDKKKKKKKKVDLDSGLVEEAADVKTGDAAEHEDMFSLDLKKKKRQKMDYATFVAALGDLFDYVSEPSGKKKKSKRADDAADAVDAADDDEDDDEDVVDDNALEGDDMDDVAYDADPMAPLQGTDRDYTYSELLSRAFYKIRQANPEMGDKKRYTMIPPQVLREGTKKTIFGNLMDICKRMHRNQDHVVQFLFTELGTSGSVDGSGRLVIKGRYTPKIIENVLRHYIVEYVTCKICKSPNTVLVKENRLNFVHCESCNSTRSVAAIKSGFSAQIGRRKH